ncbi:hypothetical protein FA95DRAFT_616206 [Auriscalpium vulgare]|uniref:Uncharacterized protein n=1 Tax=Auriscalpium vulgare TaxID=40419 RepID=A0ACB8RDV1_9AGAM|nr:hypothetical protein FA95DRAFT_616206 [Auriscalpium vulgare]
MPRLPLYLYPISRTALQFLHPCTPCSISDRRSSLMPAIPWDVQLVCVEWVYRSTQHSTVDYATLRACALVCRAWTSIAQRLLFRRVPCGNITTHSPTSHAVPRLLQTLRSNPSLAEHIHSASLLLWLDAGTAAEDDAFLTLLELCPNVKGLFIGYYSKEWSLVVENRLRAITLQPLFLSIKVVGKHAHAHRIMQIWPSVYALEVHTWEVTSWAPTPTDESTPPFSLKGVRSLTITSNNRERILAPENDLSAVCEVELRSPNWADGRLIASGLLLQLHTLIISGGLPPPEILDQLTLLDSLVFSQLPTHDVWLPKNLRHVGFHCQKTEPPKSAGPMSRALHLLQHLQLVTVTRHSPPAVLKTLGEVCCDRGVEFLIYEEPDCFWRSRDVDWI